MLNKIIMKNTLAFIILSLAVSTFAQDNIKDTTPFNTVSFESLLNSTNMIFEPPKDYIEVEPIENRVVKG
jgi:hypothetical protein